MSTMTSIIGIDIAKDKFDVCLLNEEGQGHQESFVNTKSGINKLHGWMKKQGAKTAHVCLEATGVYGDLVAETLHQRGYRVSVVNPARIKAYAASQMQRNKTDILDAALIADYCRTQQPPAWEPPTPELKELRALVRHLDDLKQEKQRASNRLEAQNASQEVRQQLRAQIAFLNKQCKKTEQLIRDHINKHPDLRQQRALLTSIPGIGDLTACRLLAELGDIRRFDDVREVVAFVGLNPRQHQSGKKRVTHGISRMGRASLRAALYMPAVVASQHNPILKTWAEALRQRGLTGKQVVVAVMRKLLHLAYGILKSGRAFDPNYAHQMPIAA
jgi:transposase